MKKALLALGFLLIFTTVFAYDWQTDGFTVISEVTIDERIHQTLKDTAGREFSVIYQDELTGAVVGRIKEYRNIFYRWQSIKIENMTFAVVEDTMDIVLIPSSVMVEGTNMAEFMPAGMSFFYDGQSLQYDFRMAINLVFVRIRGIYISESELIYKLGRAFENPEAYIRRNDPDYYHAKLDELENETQTLRRDIFNLKLSVATLQNRGLFGRVHPIDKDVAERIVLIKRRNMDWTVSQIKEQLRKDNIKFGRRDVELIIGVFFNEF
jgi:hypothetical protein